MSIKIEDAKFIAETYAFEIVPGDNKSGNMPSFRAQCGGRTVFHFCYYKPPSPSSGWSFDIWTSQLKKDYIIGQGAIAFLFYTLHHMFGVHALTYKSVDSQGVRIENLDSQTLKGMIETLSIWISQFQQQTPKK